MAQVAFDIGNVICDLDLYIFIDKLIELNVVESRNDGMRILTEIQHAQDVGLISLESYLLDTLKVKRTIIDDLMEAWHNTISPNANIVSLLADLKERGAEIALLSNIGYDHSRMLRKEYGNIFNDFIHHFSCEVGARKPFKLFYQSFLFENPKFNGCIYLDDIKENVYAANRAGLRGYIFDLSKHNNSSSIKKDFNSILKNLWLPNCL